MNDVQKLTCSDDHRELARRHLVRIVDSIDDAVARLEAFIAVLDVSDIRQSDFASDADLLGHHAELADSSRKLLNAAQPDGRLDQHFDREAQRHAS